MSFETQDKRLTDIFQRQACYVVPRYQRAYVWERVNWYEFYRDIEFTLVVEEGRSWTHFLGAIVLNKLEPKAGEKGIDQYEIIDGQQRLMTVYIALAAMYGRFLALGPGVSEARASYIRDNLLLSLTADGERRPKVSNPDHDSELMEILQAAECQEEPSKGNPYTGVYTFFRESFSQLNLGGMDAFFEKMLQVSIVEIVSGQEEEIYNIFEVLNARGQRLKQLELLKNHVLKYLQPRDTDFLDRAKERWAYMVRVIEGVDGDDFINHFAKAYLPRRASGKSEVYRLMKDEILLSDLSAFLDDMVRFAECYMHALSSGDSAIEYFELKQNRQVRPLIASMMLLLESGVIDRRAYDLALLNLRNFFFRFNVERNTSNRIDKRISDASYAVYHCEYAVEFVMTMTGLFRDLAVYISDENYHASLFANPSLAHSNKHPGKRNGRLVKYILLEYCNYMQGDIRIKADEVNIEHLANDDGSFESSLLFSLTLTSPEINGRTLENRPIGEKVRILSEMSNIRANRELGRYMRNGVFDFEARGADMEKALRDDVFPFRIAYSSVSIEELEQFLGDLKLAAESPELLVVLREHGKNFRARLSNDPRLAGLRDEFLALGGVV